MFICFKIILIYYIFFNIKYVQEIRRTEKSKIFKMSYIIAFDITEKQNIQFIQLSQNRFIRFKLHAQKFIWKKMYLAGLKLLPVMLFKWNSPRHSCVNFSTNNDLNYAIAEYAKSRYDEQKQTTLYRLYMVTKHSNWR